MSDLPQGLQANPRDMGPIGRHVASLNRYVGEHMRLTPFIDGVSCTIMDWLQRSHSAEKSKQERGSHGRPQSSRESSLELVDDSNKVKPRIKRAAKRRTHRNRKEQKKRLDPPGGEEAVRRGGGHHT